MYSLLHKKDEDFVLGLFVGATIFYMHRNVLLGFCAFLYYALATYALYSFEAGLLLTTLVLFGLPSYALARFSAAPGAVIIAVIVFGAGMGLLLEGIAHIYGIWYTIGVDELRIFGLVPVEILLSSVLQTLFLALLYELFFDDGTYTTSSARVRFVAFGVFVLSVLGLLALHRYVLDGIFFSHSYLWVIGIFAASSIAALAVHKSFSLRFTEKLFSFCLIAWTPLVCGVVLAVGNTHKVFAYTNDYIFSFSMFREIVPIEELLLALILPLFVATFYELYLDDGRF